MPPVGISESRASIDGQLRTSYIVRCGAENCWFVGHAPESDGVQKLLDEHECPQPPYRNELPTGRSILEKTWDEIDAVTDALAEKRVYHCSSGSMSGDQLIGYARGLAFTLSMMTHPHFRTTREIAAEVRARRMMRIGKMEFRETPGYRYNPSKAPDPSISNTRPAVKREPAARQVPPSFPPIPEDKQAPIKAALAMGNFTVAELAKLFNYHPSQIEKLKS